MCIEGYSPVSFLRENIVAGVNIAV